MNKTIIKILLFFILINVLSGCKQSETQSADTTKSVDPLIGVVFENGEKAYTSEEYSRAFLNVDSVTGNQNDNNKIAEEIDISAVSVVSSSTPPPENIASSTREIEATQEDIKNADNPPNIDLSVETNSSTVSDNYNFNTYNTLENQNTYDKFVLNTNPERMKIHDPNCNDVLKIKPSNYATTNLSISELVSQGYSPCGHCNPHD